MSESENNSATHVWTHLLQFCTQTTTPWGHPLKMIIEDCVCIYIYAHGVMVIVVGNGHGDTSSNPGWDWLHFT